MANNKNLAKDGEKTRFSSTNQPANSGRRPSVFAKYIRENRVSLDDLRALITSILGYDAAEIQAILNSKTDKPPVGIILLLKSIKADIDKGDLSNFEKLCNRVFGKPVQQYELSSNRDNIPTDPKQRQAIADTLRKELGIRQAPQSSAKKTVPKKETDV